jgi:hypothetical protein
MNELIGLIIIAFGIYVMYRMSKLNEHYVIAEYKQQEKLKQAIELLKQTTEYDVVDSFKEKVNEIELTIK